MRYKNWLLVGLLVALGFNIGIGLAVITKSQAVQAGNTYLPHVSNQQPPKIAAEVYTLVTGDNSFISAARSPFGGCNFFAFIDRDNGNVIHVMRQTSLTLVEEVPLPPEMLAFTVAPSPQFVPPGEKHADVSILITDVLELYFTARPPDQPSGPFNVMRLRMSVPPCTGPM